MKLTPINGKTETEGSEFFYRGTTLVVARAGNVNFKRSFRELMKPYSDELDSGRLDEEKSKEIMIAVTCESILVGWDKLVDVNGDEYEYTMDNAVELLTDDSDCYEAILKFSEDIENYLVEKEEKLKGK